MHRFVSASLRPPDVERRTWTSYPYVDLGELPIDDAAVSTSHNEWIDLDRDCALPVEAGYRPIGAGVV